MVETLKLKAYRILTCFLACVLLLISFDLRTEAVSLTPPALSGTTYTVSTSSQLRWIAGVCNGTIKMGSEKYPLSPDFLGYTIILKNNVSVGTLAFQNGEYALESGEVWQPIGTEETPFAGTFDGNECSVSGIFVDSENKYSGFFGVIKNGTVSNLTVKGYVGSCSSAGGIAGKANGKISGCLFVGRVDGERYTGGIVGEVYGSADKSSELYLNVSTGNINAFSGDASGGIVGYAEYTNVVSCSGGVELYSQALYTAGIVGRSGNGVSVSCCNSQGTITADGERAIAGGILGASDNPVSLVNNSFSGSVYCSSEKYSLCGGIAGSYVGKIENSFVNGGVYASLYFDEEETLESVENSDDVSEHVEKVCISAGIAAETKDGEINNCYFSGISECLGLTGEDICPSTSKFVAENTFYSFGHAYILYGTENTYHVMALLDALKGWTSSKTGYSSWQSVSGVNDTKPLLKHTNVAGSDGRNAWKVEGTVFTYFVEGNMDDYYENQYGIIDTPWAVYRATIRTVKIKEGVTRIGNNSFNSFDNLRTLTLPTTLQEIGDYAFEQCIYLKNFTFPASLTDIGAGAFRRCKALTKVVIPNKIRAIRKNTFAYCAKLASVTIPSSVSLIGNKAFSMCDSLTVVSLPETVREIDDYAFYYCDNLSEIIFPKGLNRIGSYAFGRCEKLVNFDIPFSTVVEEGAFWSLEQKGDVDGDGRYSVFDYLKIKAHFLGVSPLTKEQIKAADSDFNGRVNATDYLYVKKLLMGIQE